MSISPKAHDDLAFTLALPNDWQEDPNAVPPTGDGSNWTSLASFGPKSNASQTTDANTPPKSWAMILVFLAKAGS